MGAQLSQSGRLQPLGLAEVLDWTSAALDRVERAAFFARFDEGEAAPCFYEPFLEAFDPGLRKQLGVWYTPSEVARYMVARVDRALKDDLGVSEGLAAENVYVLDPRCGTGVYLAEGERAQVFLTNALTGCGSRGRRRRCRSRNLRRSATGPIGSNGLDGFSSCWATRLTTASRGWRWTRSVRCPTPTARRSECRNRKVKG